MKKFLLLVITAFFAQLPLEGLAQSDFKKQMEMMNLGNKQEVFIAQFAQQAKDRDSAAIVKEIDPLVLKENGEATTLPWLESSVFPFFARYSKLHTYRNITNATLPDGRAGLWHYTYIIDTEGKVLPFAIAVIDSADGPRLLSVIVNECVKARHPTCDLASLTKPSTPSEKRASSAPDDLQAFRTLIAQTKAEIHSDFQAKIRKEGVAPCLDAFNQLKTPGGPLDIR
jgi:hypothetical protein